MVIDIQILGSRGKLSNGLRKLNLKIEKIRNSNKEQNKSSRIIKVSTFSPTLQKDTKDNYFKELKYYKKLIKNLKRRDHLVFISSQTVELTNTTFYSKAKIEIENLLKKNLKNFTILRPGMIFDTEKNCFLLESMNSASKGYLTFFNDTPKTTVCSLNDIYQFLEFLRNNLDSTSFDVVNIGLKRYRFFELQDKYLKKPIRLRIVPFLLLKIISLVNIRMKAYISGKAISSSPSTGWLSSFD